LTALERLGEATYNAAVFFGLVDKKNQVTPQDIDKTKKEVPWWMPDYAVKGAAQSSKDSNAAILQGVNEKLAASIKMADLTPISGQRTLAQEEALKKYQINGQWYTAEGRPVAGAGSHHISGNAVDVSMYSLKQFLSKHTEDELKETYNLYRPLGAKDPNHLELFNPNRTDIYVNTGDGVSQKAATMAGKQR